MTDSQKIDVLIAEDQLITRLGLKVVIERFPEFRIVAEVENGQAALEQAKALQPKVVVMDVGMPQMDGIEATKRIKEAVPSVGVLILTSHDHDEDIFAALAAGADGYCLKDASAENLASAIRTVSQNASWLDPAIAKKVLRASVGTQARGTASPRDSQRNKFALSEREIEVLQLLVDGLTNQQMSDKLVISIETVKTHMRHVMEKLCVSDRTQAAVKALREGLLLARERNE